MKQLKIVFVYIYRCPTYNNVPQGCTLRTDPSDNCCLVPYCPNNIPTPAPSGAPTIVVTPGVNPGQTGTNTPVPQYIYPTPIQPGTITGTGVNPNTGSSSTGMRCMYIKTSLMSNIAFQAYSGD